MIGCGLGRLGQSAVQGTAAGGGGGGGAQDLHAMLDFVNQSYTVGGVDKAIADILSNNPASHIDVDGFGALDGNYTSSDFTGDLQALVFAQATDGITLLFEALFTGGGGHVDLVNYDSSNVLVGSFYAITGGGGSLGYNIATGSNDPGLVAETVGALSLPATFKFALTFEPGEFSCCLHDMEVATHALGGAIPLIEGTPFIAIEPVGVRLRTLTISPAVAAADLPALTAPAAPMAPDWLEFGPDAVPAMQGAAFPEPNVWWDGTAEQPIEDVFDYLGVTVTEEGAGGGSHYMGAFTGPLFEFFDGTTGPFAVVCRIRFTGGFDVFEFNINGNDAGAQLYVTHSSGTVSLGYSDSFSSDYAQVDLTGYVLGTDINVGFAVDADGTYQCAVNGLLSNTGMSGTPTPMSNLYQPIMNMGAAGNSCFLQKVGLFTGQGTADIGALTTDPS